MGAWGTGPFDNDSALDFVDDIEGVDDLLGAFGLAQNEYIDVDEACSIVAAAECVAAKAGSPHPDLPEELAEKLPSLPQPDAALIQKARTALAMVGADSELVELWDEDGPSDDSAQFHAEMKGLSDRLDKAAERAVS